MALEEQMRCGVPYVCNAEEEPGEAELAATKDEIEQCGATVKQIVVADNRQPRFFVDFTAPMMMARQQLEAKNYDVGTQMQADKLAFYVSARRERTSGSWE